MINNGTNSEGKTPEEQLKEFNNRKSPYNDWLNSLVILEDDEVDDEPFDPRECVIIA